VKASESSQTNSALIVAEPAGVAIEQAAVTVLEHASRISSSQWLSQQNKAPMPAFRLSRVEKLLLKTLLKLDKHLINMCNDNKWELAAARWRTLITALNDNPQLHPDARTARPMTEDTMRKEVKLARAASVREAEQQHIHLLTANPKLVYKPVSARQTPLTRKEEALLMELATKYPSGTKGKIRWKDLGSAWRIRWTAGKEIQESDIHPRSVKQLIQPSRPRPHFKHWPASSPSIPPRLMHLTSLRQMRSHHNPPPPPTHSANGSTGCGQQRRGRSSASESRRVKSADVKKRKR